DVDCANCANLMEQAAKKTAGVKDASESFMTLKMTVEFEEGADEKRVMKDVLKACRKVEPDCDIEL
ncbi:MAG: heavy-metal-associated domain-containing protein, partial [Selenomonas sp.]|nr:heavy-metal-associated domain-containing protein [Selenomonas sp.]